MSVRDQQPGISTSDPARRYALIKGLYFHLAIFLGAMLVLYVVNSNTRGPDGEWWILWPLQLWSIAWGFHLWGVAIGSQVPQRSQ